MRIKEFSTSESSNWLSDDASTDGNIVVRGGIVALPSPFRFICVREHSIIKLILSTESDVPFSFKFAQGYFRYVDGKME